MDKYLYEGHYDHITGNLGTRLQQAAAKQSLDEDLVAMLHTRNKPASPNCSLRTAFSQQAAGVFSHQVHSNKIDSVYMEQDMDPSQCPKSNLSDTSSRVFGKHNDDGSTRAETIKQEVFVEAQMGRKKKEGFTHMQLDDPSSVAGGYNKDVGGVQPTRRGCQNRQVSPGTSPPRHDMHMIMTPQNNDPPLSTGITSSRKHAGTFRVPSKHSEKISARCHQEVMRYEIIAGQDQPNTRGICPPVDRNPINHEGWEEPTRTAFMQHMPCKSPNTAVAQITNHAELAQQAAAERTQRLTTDKNFADLCSQTETVQNTITKAMSSYMQRNHHAQSNSMAASLKWDT